MSTQIPLRGLRATTLGGYLSALGLLRILATQHDTTTGLRWADDLPVLTGASSIEELTAWLLGSYQPSPIVSPWNAGAGFAGNGKSVEAERALAQIEGSQDPRVAVLREAIAAGRKVVAEGRARGWSGESLWVKQHKQSVISLCRNTFPDEALSWIDVAAVLSGPDVHFNPVAGTGGNFGRQELSATYLQHLALVLGPEADHSRAAAWVRAALTGDEDVPYKRGAVGQFDPGRAGGVLASIWGEPDKQGFVNPWRTILTCEGLLLFASAAVRRNAADPGAAWPFSVHATPIGHPTASARETAKGEIWAPLWKRPANLAELEQLFGEGRAQWAGAQAKDGLLFALAISALGVDRNLAAFRRFVIVERLGQNPIAIRATDVPVALRNEHTLLAEPYVWLTRLRRKDKIPAGVVALLRQCDQALFAAITGSGTTAMSRFVIAFGRLHEAVARSGRLREDIAPYQPRQSRIWNPPTDAASQLELQLASALASLKTRTERAIPALRPLLTRVTRTRDRLVWADSPATGTELLGSTLAQALAQAHRLHLQSLDAAPGDTEPPAAELPVGQTVALPVLESFVDGDCDDEVIADYLRGLMALGWTTSQPASALQGRTRNPVLSVLLPFFATDPFRLVSTWGPDPVAFTATLRPRPDWIARLIAAGSGGVLDDALLRLQLAGCQPMVGRPPDRDRALAAHHTNGTRLAAALLMRVRTRDRTTALSAATATRPDKASPVTT
ncbi:type I-U CRISPR-associated protein Csx17 [Streptomyces sp. NPDC001851]|uniref:type I-G CRISPR-associated protein Cas8g1/Csx17 n=1 Tax=Streptomyces sp. NPDC001851 TaxID=3154529 RepID=UPI00331BD45E